jgi:hypothetical protein
MRRLTVFSLMCGIVILSGCARARSISGLSDFSIDGQLEQRVSAGEAKKVIIRCRCPKRTVFTAAGNDIVLHIKANYSSVGYHGDQTVPTQIEPGQMGFAQRSKDDALLLDSREQSYIHHLFLLTDVAVEVPKGMELQWEILDWSALEARDVAPAD